MAKKEGKTAVDSPTSMEKAQKQFTDIATDLFNIEVNTILRDNITAQKMPTPRHALIDIGKMYKKAMEKMDPADQNEIDELTSLGEYYGSFDGFSILREWASRLMKDDHNNKIELSNDQLSILPRIKDNSDLLKGMFRNLVRNAEPVSVDWASMLASMTNNYSRSELNELESIPTLPLNEQQLVLIRKIWELGTETIVMQTIVQVDGDVITRLNSNFLNNEHYPKARSYHNKGIEIALEHWAGLVEVAKELMIAAGEGISNVLK